MDSDAEVSRKCSNVGYDEQDIMKKSSYLEISRVERVKNPSVENRWSWMVLFASVFGTTVVGCSYCLFSLLYRDFILFFDTSTASAGWIGSMHVGCGNMLAIFLGVAVEKLGCRLVCVVGSITAALGYFLSFFANHIAFIYFSYGFLAGIGTGTIAMASVIATQQYFDERRAFAGALATGGFSIGTIISGLVMRYLYVSMTWQSICVLFAGFILQMVVLATLAFRPLPDISNPILVSHSSNGVSHPDRKPKSQNAKFCGTSEYVKLAFEPALCCYLAANFFIHLGMNTFYQHTPNRALSLGITPAQIAIWPITSAVANGVAKIVGGIVANLPSVNRLYLFSAAAFCSGLIHAMMPLCLDYTSIMIQGFIQNLANGCLICVITTILVDLKGIEALAKTQALLALVVGLGVLVSTPFSGYLYDVTNNYDTAFIVTGLLTIFGSVLSLLSAFIHKRTQKYPHNLEYSVN